MPKTARVLLFALAMIFSPAASAQCTWTINPFTGMLDCKGEGGTVTVNAEQSFSSGATTVTVTDNMGTTAKVWACFVGTAPNYVPLLVNTVQINSNSVVLGFDAASGDGKCVVNGLSAASAGGATRALDNLASVSINTSLIPQTGVDLGAQATPFRDFWLYGGGTFGSHSIKLTGTPTGNRTVTLPDYDATMATLAGAEALTNKTISSFLSGTVTVSGSANTLSVGGTTNTLVLINEGSGQSGQVFEATSSLTTSPRGLMSSQYNSGTDGARLHLRKGRGTRSSPTVVVTGDNLGRLVASGYDGTNFLEMGSIIFGTEGTIGSTRVPTNIQFLTATDAAPSVLTEAMRVNAAQNIGIGTGSTISAAVHITRNGALSTGNGPAMKLDGTWITGGSATTTKPYVLIEPSGTTSTAWSTSGTGLGVNAASGFGGNIVDFQIAAISQFKVDSSGNAIALGLVSAPNGFRAPNSSQLIASSNGIWRVTDSAASDFNRLQFGGTTSSFPSLKRSTTGLIFRLADDSADTWLQASMLGVGTAPTTDLGALQAAKTRTITGTVADGLTAAITLAPTYSAATAQTVTRHNYIELLNPTLTGAGPAAVTDAAAFWFDAAAGTHKALDSGTIKLTPGGVDAWIKVNINGTIYYVAAYTSKTI